MCSNAGLSAVRILQLNLLKVENSLALLGFPHVYIIRHYHRGNIYKGSTSNIALTSPGLCTLKSSIIYIKRSLHREFVIFSA